MNSNHDRARGFTALARHLGQRRDTILDAWRRAAERDPFPTHYPKG